mmetsp:Transcript_6075/g.10899  ORF Transcript_6075/g.10899 Transcript_6075/m.10899 type:complete len:1558 (-) Transcript_6075:114-4787(-)
MPKGYPADAPSTRIPQAGAGPSDVRVTKLPVPASADKTLKDVRVAKLSVQKAAEQQEEEEEDVQVGDRVTLVGLSATELNGKVGTLQEKLRNRCRVNVDGLGIKILHINSLVKCGSEMGAEKPGGDVASYAAKRNAEREAEMQAAKEAERQAKAERQVKVAQAKAKRNRAPEPPLYTVAGTWDNWVERVMRWSKEERAYEFTMMIGEKGWESFKILLEGDWMKSYYPDRADANPYEQHAVGGPGDAWLHQDWSWTIGRHPRDTGKEGVCYKILLFVSSDFKVERVDWVRRNFGTGDLVQLVDLLDCPEWNGLCGTLGERAGNGWQVYVDGVGYVLLEPHNFKTIETRSQAELEESASEDEQEDSDVLLEGDRVELMNLQAHPTWNGLKGTLGELLGQRWQVDVDGCGMKLLQAKNLKKVRKPRRTKTKKKASKSEDVAGRASFAIAGTWDNWTRRSMNWDPERRCFQSNVQVGKDGEESFQILLDGDWAKCFHPDKADACPHADVKLCGPDENGQGLNWTIGKHQLDKSISGACYEVRLFLDAAGTAVKVDWVQLDGLYIGAPAPTLSADAAGDSPSAESKVAAAGKERIKQVLPWHHNGQPEQPEASSEGSGAAEAIPSDDAAAKASGDVSSSGSGAVADLPTEVAQSDAAPQDEQATLLKTFLHSANRDWDNDVVLDAVVKKLSKIGIESVPNLCSLLREDKESLNLKLREVKAKEFGSATMGGLVTAARRWDQVRREKEWREEAAKRHREKAAPPKPADAKPKKSKTETPTETTADAQDAASLHVEVRVLRFKVVHDKALVRDQPRLDAPVIGCKSKFDVVGATEETFDGWVRLSEDPGWILRDMGGHRGIDEVLAPLAKPFLVAATEDLEGPRQLAPLGRPVFSAVEKTAGQGRKFQVLFSPKVNVYAQPDQKSALLVALNKDEEVIADAQTYDGWLRIRMPGPGGAFKHCFVLAVDLTRGVMLQCSELEEKRAQLAQIYQAEDDLAAALGALDVDGLERALDYATKVGVDKEKIEEAQRVMVQLERHAAEMREAEAKLKERKEEIRRIIERDRFNEGELQEILLYVEREAWADEITLVSRYLADLGKRNKDERRAVRERIKLSKGNQVKLVKCLEIAEKAKFDSEVKLAQRLLDELAGGDAHQERKRRDATKKQREALMKNLARAALRGNETKVDVLRAAAIEAGFNPQTISVTVLLARIEGAARRGEQLKVNELSEEAEDAGISATEIRQAFMNGRIAREQKAGGVESDSDSGRSGKSLDSRRAKSDNESDNPPSLTSDLDSGDDAPSNDRRSDDIVEDPGRPASFSYEPLILVGSCNNWSVEEARLRFHLQPVKVGPTLIQREHRVYMKVDRPTEFQLIGAKVGWDFRIYPDSVINSILELDQKARALVARGKDNDMAHGRNFTIHPQVQRDVEIRILWKSNVDVWVWFTIPGSTQQGTPKLAALPTNSAKTESGSLQQGLKKLLGRSKAVDQDDTGKANGRHVADGVDKSSGSSRALQEKDKQEVDEVFDVSSSAEAKASPGLASFNQWLDAQDKHAGEEDEGEVSEVD